MKLNKTRWVALMIQLDMRMRTPHTRTCGSGWGGWLTPTTYIQLAGAGSIYKRNKNGSGNILRSLT